LAPVNSSVPGPNTDIPSVPIMRDAMTAEAPLAATLETSNDVPPAAMVRLPP
jgi:hypothetical protein